MADKKHAMWLENRDGERHLFHADDVEAAKGNGYTAIEGVRANGEPWNPTDEDALASLDAAAESQKASNDYAAKKAEKKAKEDEANRKANEEAQKAHDQKPDFKVEVVEPKKSK
jgi:hypothetical protein